jgi:DNA-binding Xre family transcriptional regulator
MDKRLTLFEFCLTRILAEHLAEKAGRNRRTRFRRLSAVRPDCRLLLSLMVHAGGARDEEAEDCFRRAASGLLPEGTGLLPRGECNLQALERSLQRLQALTPLLKAPVVDACAFAVMDDNKVQVAEAELLRAICTLLDCPMPPLFERSA